MEEQTQTYSPDQYPFSSVIDWRKEEEKLAKRKEQQIASQQKMAKTQLLGDTFKLLGETVGAFAGADVSKRETNPFFTKALQDKAQAETDYLTDADKLKQQRYSTLLQDRQRQLQLSDQAKKDETAGQSLQEQRQYNSQQDEAAHNRAIALQQLRAQQSMDEINRRAQIDAQQQQAKDEATKKENTLSIASYDDPINTKIDIDKTEAINLLSDFKNWYTEKYPYDELPATANIDKSGLIRDEDIIKTIRNFPEFFSKYYPNLYTKGYPEPEKPDNKRFTTFDNNVNAAIERYKIDPSWNQARQARVQGRLQDEMERLSNEYKDVLEYRDWQERQGEWSTATGNRSTEPVPPTKEGVTDVSSFWN